MQSVTIPYSRVADMVLARAALCDDVTGRGEALADGDEEAILCLARPAMVRVARAAGCGVVAGPAGWVVTLPDGATLGASAVADALVEAVASTLTGGASVPPPFVAAPPPPLRPEW